MDDVLKGFIANERIKENMSVDPEWRLWMEFVDEGEEDAFACVEYLTRRWWVTVDMGGVFNTVVDDVVVVAVFGRSIASLVNWIRVDS
jgi:hypothetical protein